MLLFQVIIQHSTAFACRKLESIETHKHFDVNWVNLNFIVNYELLTYFKSMLHLSTPWKSQKISGFLTFSGGIEMEHWLKMG